MGNCRRVESCWLGNNSSWGVVVDSSSQGDRGYGDGAAQSCYVRIVCVSCADFLRRNAKSTRCGNSLVCVVRILAIVEKISPLMLNRPPVEIEVYKLRA